MKTCEYCGKKNFDIATTCERCNQPLAENTQNHQAPPTYVNPYAYQIKPQKSESGLSRAAKAIMRRIFFIFVVIC